MNSKFVGVHLNSKFVRVHPKDLVCCQSCGNTMMSKETGKCFSCGFVSAFSPGQQERLGPGKVEYKKMNDEEFDKDGEVKFKINNLVWVHASPDITLERAEDLACDIYNLIQDTWREDEKGHNQD